MREVAHGVDTDELYTDIDEFCTDINELAISHLTVHHRQVGINGIVCLCLHIVLGKGPFSTLSTLNMPVQGPNYMFY